MAVIITQSRRYAGFNLYVYRGSKPRGDVWGSSNRSSFPGADVDNQLAELVGVARALAVLSIMPANIARPKPGSSGSKGP
jgi:hypothetical protein